jgi:POT family proton-dependent oligopeptide transporter
MIGVIVGGIAHVILVIPAVPSVIQSGKAFGPFMVSVLILAVGAGLIKPCLAPLLCDQVPVKRPVVSTLKSGERVIIDPQSTVQRYLLIFYWCINIGAFWQIATSYTSRLVGFWLAYLLPVVLYLGVPLVLFFAKKHLYIAPAQGSVVLESLHVLRDYYKTNGLIKGLKGGSAAWNKVKPSYKREQGIEVNERKIFWDDLFVDEIRQTISACALSFILPIFYLADGGIGNMENDMVS